MAAGGFLPSHCVMSVEVELCRTGLRPAAGLPWLHLQPADRFVTVPKKIVPNFFRNPQPDSARLCRDTAAGCHTVVMSCRLLCESCYRTPCADSCRRPVNLGVPACPKSISRKLVCIRVDFSVSGRMVSGSFFRNSPTDSRLTVSAVTCRLCTCSGSCCSGSDGRVCYSRPATLRSETLANIRQTLSVE